MAASRRGEQGADAALAQLCEAYWYPLYLFARRRGSAHEDALDLVQDYFLKLMERDYLGDVRPEAGRFRSFLLVSLKNHMLNARRDATRLKRGGGHAVVPLDGVDARDRYRVEPAHNETPERAYERVWARTVVDRAKAQLASRRARDGDARRHELLCSHVFNDGTGRSYGDTAELLGTSEAAVKMGASRLRRRFGILLREEIARTLDDPDEVDGELRHLLAALRA